MINVDKSDFLKVVSFIQKARNFVRSGTPRHSVDSHVVHVVERDGKEVVVAEYFGYDEFGQAGTRYRVDEQVWNAYQAAHGYDV